MDENAELVKESNANCQKYLDAGSTRKKNSTASGEENADFC